MRRVIHVSVNQNFRNRELTEIRSAYLGFIRTATWETQIQEALKLCSTDYKTGEAYEGKNCKATVSYSSFMLRVIIGAGNKVLIKQELIGVQNGCIVKRGDILEI